MKPMQGELIEVHVIHRQGNKYGDIRGVFITHEQAVWYFQADLPLGDQLKCAISVMSAFRPNGQDRALLVYNDQWHQLNSDYLPEEEARRLTLQWQAWNRLTTEERKALGLKEPPAFPNDESLSRVMAASKVSENDHPS